MSFNHGNATYKRKNLGFIKHLIKYLISIRTFQETVAAGDNGLHWIVDSYFPPPPDGAIPDDDTKPPGTEYYSRSAPTWNEVYESTTIIVYCK